MTITSAIRRSLMAPVLCAGLLAPAGLSAAETEAQPASASNEPESDVANYCQNTADATAEARIAWQTWKLLALKDSLQQQLEALEKKRAEFQEWVERRNKILAAVEDHVVSIYGRMRPDAAAQQLATVDQDIAVAVLSKLKSREAGAILNEMEPARAAQIAQSMASLTAGRIGEGS